VLLLRTPATPLLNAVVWRLGMVDSRVRDGVPSPPDDVHAVAITMEMLAPRQARAYCGPAHHRHWAVPPDIDPPEIVELPTPAGIARYHLVHTTPALGDQHVTTTETSCTSRFRKRASPSSDIPRAEGRQPLRRSRRLW